MPFFDPEKLADWSEGKWHGTSSDITGFNIDSRKIKPGEMFVAIRAKRDGHDFLDQAKLNGASSALVEKVKLDSDLPQLEVKILYFLFIQFPHVIGINLKKQLLESLEVVERHQLRNSLLFF